MPSRKNKPSSSVSTIKTIGWCFLSIWILALSYAWYSGYLHSSNSESLRYVDKVLNEAEEKFRQGILHLHVPQLPTASIESKYKMHVIFSTDCGTFQDWQSLVVFHSASVVNQQGPITRIASGCDDEKKKELTALYKKLYPHYHVHFTPDFKHDASSGKSYDFYNKPYGNYYALLTVNFSSKIIDVKLA